MSHLGGPKGPSLVPGARPESEASPEPFRRLATLAGADRTERSRAPTYEERTGALIRQAAAPPRLESDALERVWLRLGEGRTVRHRGRIGPSLTWAVLVTVLMTSGAVVGAQTGAWTWPSVMVRRLIRHAPPLGGDLGNTGHGHGGPARQVVAMRSVAAPPLAATTLSVAPAPVLEVAPVVAPAAVATSPRAVGKRMPGRSSTPAAPVAQAAAVSTRDTTLAEENRLLGRIIGRLRHQGNPTEALVDLDQYAARFPAGLLSQEAYRARVDALLMAGRGAEARSILSRLALGTGARDRELRLIRAELGAENDCTTAMKDFHAVLVEAQAGPLAERALWGRAVCRARLGDETGARVDLADYLARFPGGPQAAAARARLRD